MKQIENILCKILYTKIAMQVGSAEFHQLGSGRAEVNFSHWEFECVGTESYQV